MVELYEVCIMTSVDRAIEILQFLANLRWNLEFKTILKKFGQMSSEFNQ
jgi:DNA-binding IclR family transcriptional regulator